MTALTIVLYSIYRFNLEWVRGDVRPPGELSIAQWISFFVFFAGAALYIYSRSAPPPKPAPEPAPPTPPNHSGKRRNKKTCKMKRKWS